jgi:hypothetical protein
MVARESCVGMFEVIESRMMLFCKDSEIFRRRLWNGAYYTLETAAGSSLLAELVVGQFENLISTALQCGDRDGPYLINGFNRFPE